MKKIELNPDAELIIRANEALTRAAWEYHDALALGRSGNDELAVLRSNYVTLGVVLRGNVEVRDV